MQKSLDLKLQRLRANSAATDFILADAKDADMAYGLAAPGRSPEHHAEEGQFRTLAEYRQLIRDVTRQGLVDIMLMSCSTNEVLTIQEGLFRDSPITPAVRANDTTDIWLAGGAGRYGSQPSLPFRSTTIDHAMCGRITCDATQRQLGADLGLYSVTFNNDATLDLATLETYKTFRLEAEAKGFRHFLEVFAPNACQPQCPADVARFLNDHIAHTGGNSPKRTTRVSEDPVPRPSRHGGTCPVRPVGHRRHPGRIGRHDTGCLSHAVGGKEIRGSRGTVRPQDQ